MQHAIQRKTLIRVHVKINPKSTVLNVNLLLRDSCRLWHLVKFNTTVAVNFSNSTCISTLSFIYALTENLQKILYNSQTSVGGRKYTIILFISIIFLPTILIYLNDSEKGHHYLL